MLTEQRESYTNEKGGKNACSLFPSLLFPLPSCLLPSSLFLTVALSPHNKEWAAYCYSAFYQWGKWRTKSLAGVTVCSRVAGIRTRSKQDLLLVHSNGSRSVACFSQLPLSMFIPRVRHSQDYRHHLIAFLETFQHHELDIWETKKGLIYVPYANRTRNYVCILCVGAWRWISSKAEKRSREGLGLNIEISSKCGLNVS